MERGNRRPADPLRRSPHGSPKGAGPQPAQNRPTTAQSAEESLLSWETPLYRAERWDIQVEEGLFLPVSELNRMRGKPFPS